MFQSVGAVSPSNFVPSFFVATVGTSLIESPTTATVPVTSVLNTNFASVTLAQSLAATTVTSNSCVKLILAAVDFTVATTLIDPKPGILSLFLIVPSVLNTSALSAYETVKSAGNCAAGITLPSLSK